MNKNTILSILGFTVSITVSLLVGTYQTSANDDGMSYELPSQLVTQTKEVGTRVVERIKASSDQYFFEKVIRLLERYEVQFQRTEHQEKLAIVKLLKDFIHMSMKPIPNNCTSWFDGCNNCTIGENGVMACTEKACMILQEPMCMAYTKVLFIADHTADCVGVGPQQCLLIKETEDGEWRYFYDTIKGFEYKEGYEYKISVEEVHLDPSILPADKSSIEYTIKEVLEMK